MTRQRVRDAIQHDWQCLATRLSMRLSLPGGRVLPLGGDHIPWPNQIPESLRQLSNADLIALLTRYDDDLTQLRARGAHNWSRLHDRMGFICELFRAEQQSGNLFDSPFDEEALAAIAQWSGAAATVTPDGGHLALYNGRGCECPGMSISHPLLVSDAA